MEFEGVKGFPGLLELFLVISLSTGPQNDLLAFIGYPNK